MSLLRRVVTLTAAGCLSMAGAPAAGLTHDVEPRWPWPLSPTPALVQPFQAPTSDYGPGHRGIDLAGDVGQRVLAATEGTVTVAGPIAGRGVVVVRYGNLRLTYEPVSSTVAPGDTVAAGDVLGALALTGSHCWPDACLHVGLRQADTYLDPRPYFGPLRVRLKPVAHDPASVTGSLSTGGSETRAEAGARAPGQSSRDESGVSTARVLAGGGAAGLAVVLAATALRRRFPAGGRA